jgi:hypothetical protein
MVVSDTIVWVESEPVDTSKVDTLVSETASKKNK